MGGRRTWGALRCALDVRLRDIAPASSGRPATRPGAVRVPRHRRAAPGVPAPLGRLRGTHAQRWGEGEAFRVAARDNFLGFCFCSFSNRSFSALLSSRGDERDSSQMDLNSGSRSECEAGATLGTAHGRRFRCAPSCSASTTTAGRAIDGKIVPPLRTH